MDLVRTKTSSRRIGWIVCHVTARTDVDWQICVVTLKAVAETVRIDDKELYFGRFVTCLRNEDSDWWIILFTYNRF